MNRLKKCLSLALAIMIIIPSINVFALDDTKEDSKEGTIYGEIKVGDLEFFSPNYAQAEKEEVRKKLEESRNIKLLEKETTANFEVALAYSDGSYKYMDKADTVEDAIKKAETLEKNNEEVKEYQGTIIPAVINAGGEVVYSTNSMGRVWKHINKQPDKTNNNITLVYSNPELKKEFTYINHGYIDDVPIIEDRGNSAKVQINGYNGWLNKNQNSDNYDLVVVPINQVTNPSCYLVKNGYLYHFISNNMTSWNGNGNSIKIGLAPSYLEPNKDYYSYDGHYFYEGRDIQEGLNKLITDLKNDTKENSINPNSPYYSYYQYLPFRTRTSHTAEEINAFINAATKPTSKLRGLGKVLIECQNKYGTNPLLILGLAMNESGNGDSPIAQKNNNLFGIKAYDFDAAGSADSFATPADCVREFCKTYISRGYADPADYRYFGGYFGDKQLGANVKYASDPFWGEKAGQHAFNIDSYFNLTDYNGYQLAIYTGVNKVTDDRGNLLYDINPTVSGWGGYKGNITALTYRETNNLGLYEMFPERTDPLSNGKYNGDYPWKNRGFIRPSNVQLINEVNTPFIPGYNKEDIDKNDEINIEDLAKISVDYNKSSGEQGFKAYLDLNSDGIIDIFDLVKVSKSL
ncbi:glucosaminidase domain-containing protein [Clostridium chauvoei]|uniref:Glucosaminidase domain-containing protein n=4 Tax=Clostridium chauvoei TaxID=46867 RepID=A0ABD4RFC8_9CLOT|nr:glucosaminidase domain-containing protein [Clostridium chauvoei]ATD54275.1 hypothetical protein BTM20_03095 [Clostridium chauvoei]MBX7279882.1 glucosaminidase domain-containing protein [Clostridium chauvoei]MBX7282200.1 glucosaminidase domain-containing protein [Clostridium chauvoei]MBX7284772.1 glucosaminidase domain-containing protein [Clostridium chauvoei]MBX7287108.1 glucosaminidase domain-containing protein [Clostridium chauvoei]